MIFLIYKQRVVCNYARGYYTECINTFDAGVYSYDWFRINSFTCTTQMYFSLVESINAAYTLLRWSRPIASHIFPHILNTSIEQQEQLRRFFQECQKWYWVGKYKGMARGGIRFEIACLEWSSRSRNFVRDVFFLFWFFRESWSIVIVDNKNTNWELFDVLCRYSHRKLCCLLFFYPTHESFSCVTILSLVTIEKWKRKNKNRTR